MSQPTLLEVAAASPASMPAARQTGSSPVSTRPFSPRCRRWCNGRSWSPVGGQRRFSTVEPIAITAPGCGRRSPIQASYPVFHCRHRRWRALGTDQRLPDILAQLKQHPELQPARMMRDSGISGVIRRTPGSTTSRDSSCFRERATPLPVWSTAPVHRHLSSANPVFNAARLLWRRLAPDRGRSARPFRSPSCPACASPRLHWQASHRLYPSRRSRPHREDRIGLLIEDLQHPQALLCAGARHDRTAARRVSLQADCPMVDGTFWTDDEMIRPDCHGRRRANSAIFPVRTRRHDRPTGALRQRETDPHPHQQHQSDTRPGQWNGGRFKTPISRSPDGMKISL